jgi:thiol-disulfide isomerase/thioredoxin
MKTVYTNINSYGKDDNMQRPLRNTIVSLTAVTVLLIAFSHSSTRQAPFEVPVLYGKEEIARAREIEKQGYALLESGNLEGALAKFEEVSELMDFSMYRQYHSASAYAISGRKDEAFEWLERMLDDGFDVSRWLKADDRLESLKSDPRFGKLIERAEENYEAGTAAFANGMPDYETAPATFSTEEELDAWIQEQSNLLSKNEGWHKGGLFLSARIDFLARVLAAQRELREGDPSYDYALERIRGPFTTRLMSSFSPGWGSVTDMIIREINEYIESSPSAEGLSEACYYAGRALSMKYSSGDIRRFEAFGKARTYLERAKPGTEFYAAARALITINNMKAPFANMEELRQELKDLVERYPGDARLYRAISTGLNHMAASFLWPIHLDSPDIDGKTVTLDEYRGKVLLIDFWATWCAPCRREIPNLVRTYEAYHPRGFEILSISLDKYDKTPVEDYMKTAGEKGMKWRHVYDGNGFKSDLARRFFVGTIPAPFLVGPDGSLVAWGKDCREENLARNIEKALAMIDR